MRVRWPPARPPNAVVSRRGAAQRGVYDCPWRTLLSPISLRQLRARKWAIGRLLAYLLTYALFLSEETPRSVPMTRQRWRRSLVARYGNPDPSLLGWPGAEETRRATAAVKLHRRRQSLAGRVTQPRMIIIPLGGRARVQLLQSQRQAD